jgi:hypothetical protein
MRNAERGVFDMTWGKRTSRLLFFYLAVVATCASAQTGSTAPTVESIVAHIAQARIGNRTHFRRYTVTRDYELFGEDRTKTKSQVIADVTFVPPDLKQFVIENASGSGLGETVVRLMLENETAIAKDNRSSDISPDNYAFRFIREDDVDGQNCYVLALLPKRKDKNLVSGNVWVDAQTYLFRRIDGSLAKTPSWWLREVRIKIVYGDVGGMWLPTASESMGQVRIFGPHSIVTRDVKYDVGEPVAAGSPVATSFLKPVPDPPLGQHGIELYPTNPFVKIDGFSRF